MMGRFGDDLMTGQLSSDDTLRIIYHIDNYVLVHGFIWART